MNKIDYDFFSLIKKLELMKKEDIYLNIKKKFLSLNKDLRSNIETFLNNFTFWGKLDTNNNIYDELINVSSFLKNNLNELVSLYQNLHDYKSKKILTPKLKIY